MENKKRLIDANALKKAIRSESWIKRGVVTLTLQYIGLIIDEQKPVDAVEVVHGYNIDRDTHSLFECSVCHWSCWDTYCGDTADYNYCPNCGAKMDGDNQCD